MNIDVNRSSDDDDDYNEYPGRNGIDLFTPVRGRQRSLVRDFTPTPSRSTSSGEAASSSFQQSAAQQKKEKEKKQKHHWFGTNKNKDKSKSDNDDNHDDDDPIYASFEADSMLQAVQDTSWLGARLSPIPHGDTGTEPTIKAKPNNPNEKGEKGEKGENENNRDLPRNESSGDASSSVVSIFFQDPHDDVFSEANFRTERGSDDDKDSSSSNNRISNRISSTGGGGGGMRPRLSLWRPATMGPSAGAAYTNLGPASNPTGRRRRRRQLKTPCPSSWSDVHPVPASTALVLVIVGIHDAFLSYLEIRNGVRTSVSRAWTLPWIGPSERSLLRFGAFCPQRMMTSGNANGHVGVPNVYTYWRSLVSLCVPTSVAEWLLLAWVWNTLLCAKRGVGFARPLPWQLSWPVVYALSAGTGQLWMLVFELGRLGTEDWSQQQQQEQEQQQQLQQQQQQLQLPALSGCAGWATAGVLCSVGIRIPHRRFACFLASSVLVVLHQCQATGSSVGCAGAAFFGWALAGMWSASSASSASASSSALRWSESTRVYAYSYYSREYSLPDPEAWQEVMPPRMVGDLDRWGGRWSIGNGVAAGVVALLWSLPILFVVYR